ncbi:MAG: hypothetical protein R3Y15_01500 [Rikenellaceae bacterium]
MKITKICVALTCALMTTAGVFAQTAAEVTTKYNDAGALLQQKNYAGAIAALEEVVDMGVAVGGDALTTVESAQKLLPQCYYSAAMQSAGQKNFDAALEGFTTAAELGELYGAVDIMSRATAMISKVYMAQGGDAFNAKDWATSIDVFGKGYAANPQDTQLGLLLAKSYAENGQMDEATQTYQSIIALEARNSRFKPAADQAKSEISTYLLLMAQEAATANEVDSVYSITANIIELDPTNAAAHMMRVQTATNAKDFDSVIEFGEAAADAQVDEEGKSNAYFLLGAAYQNKENKAKAIETYKLVTSGTNVDTAKAQITALSK